MTWRTRCRRGWRYRSGAGEHEQPHEARDAAEHEPQAGLDIDGAIGSESLAIRIGQPTDSFTCKLLQMAEDGALDERGKAILMRAAREMARWELENA
jgi:hypothetical protein